MSILIQKYLQQFLFTASALYVIIDMFAGVGVDTLVYFLLALAIIAMLISGYYHRYLTHRSYDCPRNLEKVFAFFTAWFGLVQAVSWVATHRRHHKYADTEKDPHGPSRGFIHTLLMPFYEFDLRHSGSLLKDPLYIWQAKYYWALVVTGFIVTSLLIDPLFWCIVNAYAYLGQVAVSWWGHSKSGPVTREWLSPLLAGELYHEHHHNNPGDPVFGRLDLPAFFIRLIDRKVR
jgi:fatty-acid desaturase